MFHLFQNKLVAVFVSGVLLCVHMAPALASEVRGDFAVEIAAHATATPNGVLIEWHSTFRSDILGFNIYRTVGGKTSQINSSLIAGPTFVAVPRSPGYA